MIGDGSLRADLTRRAVELSLADAVTIEGWCSGHAVRAAIADSRLLVLASFAEGLPIVLMEAFAVGRPVVCTNVAAAPELVVPGRSGWLVEPGDVQGLADALRDALNASDATLRSLAQVGRSTVQRRHDVDRLMSRLTEWIEACCVDEPLADRST